MQNKPILIGFASAILILVVAAASFSAGLYLGQRGYVADLQYQSPQGSIPNSGLPAGPQAGQPAQGGVNPAAGNGPPGAPYWPPDVIGRLVSLDADSITLEAPRGQVTVAISASTVYLDQAGRKISVSDLRTGDVIAIFGTDDSRVIMRLPPNPSAP